MRRCRWAGGEDCLRELQHEKRLRGWKGRGRVEIKIRCGKDKERRGIQPPKLSVGVDPLNEQRVS